MRSRYLLDTNIVSDLIKHGEQSVILGMIRRVGDENVFTSAIVAAEIRYGVERKGSEKLRAAAARVLDAMEVIPLDLFETSDYGKLRFALEGQGSVIGPNDLLIAAQCTGLGLTLVTDNTQDFERVPDLDVVNWLHPAYRYPGAVEE